MYYENGIAKDVRITYIGGGSRGWAWNLMSDLAVEKQMGGTVTLYDIDLKAAENNEIIGNKFQEIYGSDNFTYHVCDDLRDSLKGADFVVISILPGSFDEMESDVHWPEKYGIYQSVGDTAGPGGVLRALRTMPMYVEIAAAIKDAAPGAWVINYTNPMAICIRTLYEVFPEIKAFGCCHEVFGTQELLAKLAEKEFGLEKIGRREIKVNVQGLNHFTWINEASYEGKDLFPMYAKAAEKYKDGFEMGSSGKNWMNDHFTSSHCVKFDLFCRYGVIAAAGDRHLAEFCPGWYLKTPKAAEAYKFGLTPVKWRKENRERLLETSRKRVSGEEDPKIELSGEEGVRQIKALLGLGDFVTNVNLVNLGQIGNISQGVVVETNAVFSKNSVKPVFAGNMQESILNLTQPHIYTQNALVEACMAKSFAPAFRAFIQEPAVNLSIDDGKRMFDEMIENTKEYLSYYEA